MCIPTPTKSYGRGSGYGKTDATCVVVVGFVLVMLTPGACVQLTIWRFGSPLAAPLPPTPTLTSTFSRKSNLDVLFVQLTRCDCRRIVVEKSTVPVTTADQLQQLLYNLCPHKNVHFEVLSNPEFLAEGTAVRDLEDPSRVIIGGNEETEAGRAVSGRTRSVLLGLSCVVLL